MYVNRILCLCLMLVLARSVYAIPDIQHWQTDNGTNVYFVEAHELPMVNIKLVFNAGSSRDGDKKGLSQLTSNMLFEGAGGLDADQLSRNFDNLGAVFGSKSDSDSTSIGLRVLSDNDIIDAALENLERVITSPDFEESAFERQRNRTLIGIRHKQQSPAQVANDAFFRAIYRKHPYAYPEEGTEDSLQAITPEDLGAFHKKYFVAANVIIAIVGDLSRARAEEVANRITAGLPRGEKASPLPPVKKLKKGKTIWLEHPSAQTHILVGQPGIRRDDPDLFPLYVGNHVLGGSGMVSRLFAEVREKRGLSYGTYSYFLPQLEKGPFVAALQTRTDQAGDALEVMLKELDKFIRKGPGESELEAAKQNLTGGFPLRLDSNSEIINYIAMIGFHNLPLDYLETYNDRIMAVTAEQIKAAFKRKLSPDRFIKVMVGQKPKSPGA